MKVNEIQKRMRELSNEFEQLELELEKILDVEWEKENECVICGAEGYTEWHHIISQNKCKDEGLEHLIRLRNNVVELCQRCHDLTTASLLRNNMPDKRTVSEDNVDSEPTEKQLAYIVKLGGDAPEGLTRQEASQLIDELKNLKRSENRTQTT